MNTRTHLSVKAADLLEASVPEKLEFIQRDQDRKSVV